MNGILLKEWSRVEILSSGQSCPKAFFPCPGAPWAQAAAHMSAPPQARQHPITGTAGKPGRNHAINGDSGKKSGGKSARERKPKGRKRAVFEG
jgi:hypothetical protein